MNIYYDENMPYVADFFGGMGQLFPFAGREVDAEQISNADVLLVRSITQVNQQLLARNPRIQFVGTATIGVDHIDQPYLASKISPLAAHQGVMPFLLQNMLLVRWLFAVKNINGILVS